MKTDNKMLRCKKRIKVGHEQYFEKGIDYERIPDYCPDVVTLMLEDGVAICFSTISEQKNYGYIWNYFYQPHELRKNKIKTII